MKKKTTAHWVERFEAIGVPAAAVLRPDQAVEVPQVRARGMVDRRGWIGSPLPGASLPEAGCWTLQMKR